MSKFLSEEWVTEVRGIREEFAGQATAPPHKMRMNLVITEVPAEVSDGDVDAHLDTTEGEMELELGHLENPDLTVTVGYDTAKAILVEGNPQAGMQAFMAGKIKVAGDMTKLMAMSQATPDPAAAELAARINAVTD